MPDQKLSQLTAATTPLTGSELVYVVQGGNQRRATAADVAGLGSGTDLSYDAATRTLSSSTGADVVLPEATTTLAGLMAAASLVKLNSIIVDRAQLTVAEVRNNSGVAIPKGAPVYVTGSSGIVKTVALADASTEATAANTIGVALDAISHNSNGFVVTEGPLSGVDTSALTEGQMTWLSETTGAITTTRPTQPAHGVHLGWCVKQAAGSGGILYIKVDNGYELDELHDVLIVGGATGQVLRRAADGLWKNATLTAGDVGADAAGTAASAVSTHTGAANPHSQYALSSSLGTLATANAATPPALGGTTPAAGAFTALSASTSMLLPNGAPATPLSRMLYAVADTMRYRDSTNTERLLLNAADNLANLSSTTTALANIGAAASGAVTGSGLTMATARLLGRSTAGTGAVEEITLGTGLSFSGTTLNATGGGGSGFGGYAVGNWICPVNGPLGAGSASGTADQIYLIPAMVDRSITVSELGARVATVAAGSTVQLAIYGSSNGVPTGLPLASTGDLSSATSTVISSAVISFNITAGGLYWMAVSASSISSAMVAPAGNSANSAALIGAPNLADIASSNNVFVFSRIVAATYGTWPNLTGVTTTVNAANRGAVVFLKISALL